MITFVGEISEAELAVRMVAAAGHGRPPTDITAEQLLAQTPADVRALALAMAREAILYFGDCIQRGERPQ